jgi:MFS family permease
MTLRILSTCSAHPKAGGFIMILRQYLHADPVAASYLLGCGGRAAAAVIDPLGDNAPYLAALVGSVLLGIGTAMVYPCLIAAVSDASHPTWRARSLSVYRFWRDLGYAIGALSAGIIADIFGMAWAIGAIAALTFVSGAIVGLLMRERSPGAIDAAQAVGRTEAQ